MIAYLRGTHVKKSFASKHSNKHYSFLFVAYNWIWFLLGLFDLFCCNVVNFSITFAIPHIAKNRQKSGEGLGFGLWY